MMEMADNIGCFSPLHFLPFTMVLHFSLKKNDAKFASATTKKCWPKRLFLPRILHQNTLHLAPKRTAISIKTHCI